MALVTKYKLFIHELPDGRVQLLGGLPTGVPIQGPLKILELEGVPKPPPSGPINLEEYLNSLPPGAKAHMGLAN